MNPLGQLNKDKPNPTTFFGKPSGGIPIGQGTTNTSKIFGSQSNTTGTPFAPP